MKKIKNTNEIEEIAKSLKKDGKRVVTINGTFDILHVGHLEILEEAKKQGDILIVGLNSDESVKMNKGQNRPINKQEERARMLSALEIVDYIVIFNEKDPRRLLSIIKPDVHVNGSEYGENCIEGETIKKYGGKIHIVKLKQGFSTTDIIKRISKPYKN